MAKPWSLAMQPEKALLHLSGAEPSDTTGWFEAWCRQPGTRCDAIMTMIEQGMSDHEIKRVVHADDDATIAVYRRELMRNTRRKPEQARGAVQPMWQPEPESAAALAKRRRNRRARALGADPEVLPLPEGMQPWPPSPRADGRRWTTPKMVADVRKLRELDWSRSQIAAGLGASPGSIGKIIKKYLIHGQTLKEQELTKERIALIRPMVAAGKGRREIMRMTGLTQRQVDYIVYHKLAPTQETD